MPARRNAIVHRLCQGLRGLRVRPSIPANRDAILASNVSDALAGEFRALPPFDQIHLLTVHGRLLHSGVADRDLLAAGLLHDIGKRDAHGSVRLPDRVLRVLLSTRAPRMLARLANQPGPGWRHGLFLCVHHAQLGGDRVRGLGGSERTVWLIRHHEDDSPRDPDLVRLQAADHG